MDYQGAARIKQVYSEAVTVFLLPPSMAELERRIRSRGTETEEQVKIRLAAAVREIEHYRAFDYIVVNDEIEVAYRSLSAIYEASRCRMPMQEQAARALLRAA